CLSHPLNGLLAMRFHDSGVADLGPIHQAVHGLVVLWLMQLSRQRAARVAINLVRNPHQALGSPLMSQSCLAKMDSAKRRCTCLHDRPPGKRWKPTVTSRISRRSRLRNPNLGEM